jgi:hypothetical protein
MHTDIHALSGIRTHDPRVRASVDSSSLRPRAATVIGPIHTYTYRNIKMDFHIITIYYNNAFKMSNFILEKLRKPESSPTFSKAR